MIRFQPRRLLAALFVTASVLLTIAPAASAADPMGATRRVWSASFSTGGTGGLTSYVSGMGLARVNTLGLPANAEAALRYYAGSCTASRGLVTEIGGLRTTSSGGLKRDVRVSAYRMSKVWGWANAGPISMRIAAGNTTRCANLTSPVATRVSIPGLGINLAVVRPPSTNAYPLCNVAEYLQARWQPGEPGGTFIYAHARIGMFLPLLTESTRAGGGRLPGMLVYVYTSDSKVYTYRIDQVQRHALYLPPPSHSGRLWLQTSEGPRGTRPKLILVATQVGVAAAPYAASHPAARPVRCG